MDEVVADCNKYYKYLFGVSWKENEKLIGVEKASKLVDDLEEDFWINIPLINGSYELFNYLNKYDLTFMSAPCEFMFAPAGKRRWLNKYFGNIPAIFENQKWKYASSDSILIDDNENNINNFIKHGGIGVLHVNHNDTIIKMKEILK